VQSGKLAVEAEPEAVESRVRGITVFDAGSIGYLVWSCIGTAKITPARGVTAVYNVIGGDARNLELSCMSPAFLHS
jgi:hypothetical protein